MASNLVNLVKKHAEEFAKFPDTNVARALPRVLSLKSPTLEEFDHNFTSIVGGTSPPFPFACATDYYRWASSDQALLDIRVPFLAINSADDPIVQKIPSKEHENGWTAIAVTPGGGHLGWFEDGDKFGEARRWISKPILEWLRATGEDLVCERPTLPVLYEADGWLTEVGREDLGCKRVEGGGLVIGVEGEGGLLQGL